MAKKSALTKAEFDALGRDAQADYAEDKSGMFLFQLEPVTVTIGGKTSVFALEDVHGMKTALGEEREGHRKAREQAAAFADIDPVKARDALGKVEKMKSWTPSEKLEEEKKAWEKQLVDKHAAEMKPKDDEIALLDSEVRRMTIDAEAARVLANKASLPLLLPTIRANTRVEREKTPDGKVRFVARVVDERGSPRVSMKQGSTGNMDLEEYALSLAKIPDYAPAFFGSGSSGTGASGNGGPGGSPAIDPKLPAEERLKQLRRQEAGLKS